MEEHAVVENLRESRERLRKLLALRGGGTDAADDDAFPRSAVMRFLLDARRRQLALAVMSAVWMVAGRRAVARAGAVGLLARTMKSLAGIARG